MTNYGTLNHRTIEQTDYYSLIRSDARGLRKQPAGYIVRVPEWGWHAGRHKRGIETGRYHARHLDSVLIDLRAAFDRICRPITKTVMKTKLLTMRRIS